MVKLLISQDKTFRKLLVSKNVKFLTFATVPVVNLKTSKVENLVRPNLSFCKRSIRYNVQSVTNKKIILQKSLLRIPFLYLTYKKIFFSKKNNYSDFTDDD